MLTRFCYIVNYAIALWDRNNTAFDVRHEAALVASGSATEAAECIDQHIAINNEIYNMLNFESVATLPGQLPEQKATSLRTTW